MKLHQQNAYSVLNMIIYDEISHVKKCGCMHIFSKNRFFFSKLSTDLHMNSIIFFFLYKINCYPYLISSESGKMLGNN